MLLCIIGPFFQQNHEGIAYQMKAFTTVPISRNSEKPARIYLPLTEEITLAVDLGCKHNLETSLPGKTFSLVLTSFADLLFLASL